MAARFPKVPIIAVALLAAGVVTPSCAKNNESIFVRQIQAVVPPNCTVLPDPNALAISGGVLDVGIGLAYVAAPLIGNELLAKGDPKTSRAESNRVQLKGAEVQLLDGSGSNQLFGDAGFFSVQGAGITDPTTSSDATYGVTLLDVIPASIGAKLRAQLKAKGIGASQTVIVSFKVFGTTLGGTDVETGLYEFPITVWYGCLVNFGGDVWDTAAGTPGVKNCLKNPKDSEIPTFCSALRGQDNLVPCQFCHDKDVCTLCSASVPCPEGGTCTGGSATQPGRCI